MSALFNFESFLRLAVLLICTVTYLKRKFNSVVNKNGWGGIIVYRCFVIGERLSPFVGLICLIMGLKKLISIFI